MNARRSFVSACAGALLALGLWGAPASAQGLSGIVRSVDEEGRKLVVRPTGTDKDVDVSVGDQAQIVTHRGRSMLLKDLRKGDGVGIARSGDVATRIVVRQGTLQGVVSTIDPDGKKLVVTESGTDKEVEIPVLDKTPIVTTAGKAVGLKGLKTGDGVGVSYDGSQVDKIVVSVKPEELTGHVKEVAADRKSIVINEIGSKAEVRVAVTPKTTILTAEGKTLELKDLKKGDGVGIAHEASVASKIVVNAAPPR